MPTLSALNAKRTGEVSLPSRKLACWYQTNPFVSLNVNPSIDGEFNKSAFRPSKVHESFRKKLGNSAELNSSREELERVLLSDGHEAAIIYLYRHGQNDQPFSSDQTENLILCKDLEIEPQYLNDAEKFANAPIVIINSCRSGAISPLSFSTFL